jgi:hypothetical protein
MVLDPLTGYIQGVHKTGGENPFQYWLLLNSISWGNGFFSSLFFVFPVILGGMNYYEEANTSFALFSISRKSRTKYYVSKIISIFTFTFLSFFLLFLINIVATNIIFSNSNDYNEFYYSVIPNRGTFAFHLHEISPILVEIIYSILNALTLAIFAVFVIDVQMIIKFKNKFIALIAPLITLYIISFVFDTQQGLHQYNIRMIVQPMATVALAALITWQDVIITYLTWIFAVIVLSIIGINRNKENV